jgi:hypothetical protein
VDKLCLLVDPRCAHTIQDGAWSKPLNSLWIVTEFLGWPQGVSVAGGATHTQKDDVETLRKSFGSSLNYGAEIYLCAVPVRQAYSWF